MTTSTATNMEVSTLTPQEILDRMIDTLTNLPPDPLAGWMRDQGFDPDLGCHLVLPNQREYLSQFDGGGIIPGYIRFSDNTLVPCLVDTLFNRRAIARAPL